MQTNASINLTDSETKSERDFMFKSLLCFAFFFLIHKLKNKTLKSTFGEVDPAREIFW
jgi:hypothetical protein